MRILVVSDTHGIRNNLYAVLEKEKPFDYLIHCGDVQGDEEEIRRASGCPCLFVKGNNDYFADLPQDAIATYNGCKVMVSHGHMYGVHGGPLRLAREARKKGARVLIYGHTHLPYQNEQLGLLVLNPGSLTYPRQAGRKKTYMILEIDEQGNPEATLKAL